MINSSEIEKRTINAVKIAKEIRDKYGINQEDYAKLHIAFEIIHTENLLREAQKAVKEYSTAKQKELVAIRFLNETNRQLERLFLPLPNIEDLKGRL